MNQNQIYVYFGKVESANEPSPLPKYQQEKIEKSANLSVINQKVSAYRLLKRAVSEKFGIDDDFSDISLTKAGKPVSPKYCFSISHTKELVAVAISKSDVGIDIEKVNPKRDFQKIKKIFLHENENLLLQSIDDVTQLWVKKESIFKLLDKSTFLPQNIDTQAFNTQIKEISFEGDKFYLAVATQAPCQIKYVNLL